MTDGEITNPKTFPNLPTTLQEVMEEGERSTVNIVRKWVQRHITAWMEEGYFEEEEVLATTPKMLEDAGRTFVYESAPVTTLRKAYEAIKGHEDEYRTKVLVQQRVKYERLLATSQRDNFEKKLRKTIRSIEAIKQELDRVLNTLSSETLEEIINKEEDRTLQRITRARMSIKKKLKATRNIIAEIADDQRWEARRSIIAGEIIGKSQKKIEELAKQLSVLRSRKSWLENEIAQQKTIQAILEKTRASITRLAITEPPITQSSESSCPAPVSSEPKPPSVSRKRKKGNGNGKNGKVPTYQQEKEEKDVTPPAQEESLPQAVAKLKKIIETAEENGGKIRILLPNKQEKIWKKFRAQWVEVFALLNVPEARIERVDYEHLQSTSNKQGVVLVPQAVHTHMSKHWKDALTEAIIIDALPTHIRNYLQAQNGIAVFHV